jgi:hypothetical protein
MEMTVDKLITFFSSQDEELRDISGLGAYSLSFAYTENSFHGLCSIENNHVRIARHWRPRAEGVCQTHTTIVKPVI